MSKAKKIISMLLAVAMILTVAPVSVFASALDAEVDTSYTYGSHTFTPVSFTVDTSATTEVVRIAANSGSFSVPASETTAGTIVPATQSGIPKNDGVYASVGYAGETPETPKVVFSITGATISEVPTVTSNLGDALTLGAADKVTSDSTTTFTWEITKGSATKGTDIVYTITYKVGNQSYVSYAYSHVEYILIMGGFVAYKNNDAGSSGHARHALIVQFQSKNMYSGMNEGSVSNRKIGYINYASGSPHSDKTLVGCGNSDDVDSSVNAYASAAPNDAIDGSEVGAFIKFRQDKSESRYNGTYDNDNNRSEPKIYIDKRNENLGSLNFRVTLQNGEASEFTYAKFNGIYFSTTPADFDSTTDPSSTYATSGAGMSVQSYTASPYGNEIRVTSTYNTYSFEQYAMAKIVGDGPGVNTTEDTTPSIIVDGMSDNSRTHYSAGAINVEFEYYNTIDLYNLYHGIIKGANINDGSSTYECVDTYAGTTVNFNKGVNPQVGYYNITGTEWTDYVAALKTAGSVLVTPDTTQSAIDSAAANLFTAYNALPDYYPNVNYTIKHVSTVDGSEIIPAETGTKAAGTSMVAKAATIAGHDNSGDTTINKYLSGGDQNVEITFKYTPIKKTLTIYANNPEGMGTSNIVSKTVTYGDKVDVDALVYGEKEFYTFDGWYETSDFSGSKVTDFEMPAYDVDLYAKWVTAPIVINAIPIVDGAPLTDSNGAQIVKNLGTVTPPASFARPDDSKVEVDGYLFVEYYSNFDSATGELSGTVTWPMNFVLGDATTQTIYARMVDVNGKIVFESNGGDAVSDINFAAGDTVQAPTAPTRKGYTFAGWWDKELQTEYTFPRTMANNTGFVAYAKWDPIDVTISFELDEPATDFDTDEIHPITGKADAAIEFVPHAPSKFGYTFNNWVNKATNEVFTFDKFPTEDITLVATWSESDYSAFIGIDSYEKLSGQYVETDTAQVGDVVTFRMTSLTNFYNGSTVFVFMYDKTFFELVNEGSDAFLLNSENEYVTGIDAKWTGVTDDSLLDDAWPDGIDRNTYNAMLIAIDPTVSLGNYNTEPMSDGKWLVEFQLKVKSTATGEGKVYMDNAWTRTPDNIMGTMFYGWAADSAVDVGNTTNNVVTPNLDQAYAIITLDETAPTKTTLILDANGGAWADGQTTKTFEGAAETEIINYESPVRTGYSQRVDEATGKTIWYKVNDDGTIDETVTLEAEGYYATEAQNGFKFAAQWDADIYDIHYYIDEAGEDLYTTQQVGYEEDINAPADPAEDTVVGYDFKGWADAAGNKVTFPVSCPLNGTDFYAIWEPATDTQYTIIVNYTSVAGAAGSASKVYNNGITNGTVMIVESVPANPAANTTYVTLDQLPVAMNGRYVYDPDNNTLPISETVLPDGSTVLEVNYMPQTYTYTFNADGGVFADGKEVATTTGKFQETTVLPADPTKEGYTFSKWSPNVAATYTDNRSYTAIWTANTYVATFNAASSTVSGQFADGTTSQEVSAGYTSNFSAPAAPSAEGYNFVGWATSNTATADDVVTFPTAMPLNGITYYAVYTVASFDVSYYVDGAIDSTRSEVKEYGSTVTVASKPTKEGYTFDGWYDSENNKYDAGATFTMPANSVDLNGEFKPNSYDVIFDANGGAFTEGDTTSATKAVSTVFNTAISAPATNPTRAGYEFLGWTDTKGSQTVITNYGTLTSATETVTFYAVWKATIANYIVEIYKQDVNGAYPATPDETIDTLSGTVESTVTYTPDPIDGFTLSTSESTLSGVVTAETPLVLVVKYTRNQYKLSTDVDGTVTVAGTYYYGATVPAPATPTKEGYTFKEWSPAVEATMPANDYTVTAVWTTNQYNVKFYTDADKASTVYDQKVNYGTTVGTLGVTDPTKEGHTFKGWAYEGTTTVLDLATVTVPANDIAFVGIWDVNSYNLIFRTYNGVYQQTSVAYGTAISAPATDPTQPGKTFTGWNAEIPATMPASPLTFVAQWSDEVYNVIWSIDGVETAETYKYGDYLNIPDETQTVKEGHTFTGWSPEPTETMEDIGNNGTTVTYTAQFTINTYKVIYKVDGAEYKTEEYTYGADVTTLAAPTKTGYTFSGWDKQAPATMPAENVTISGTFTVNSYNVIYMVDGAEHKTETYNYGAAVTTLAAPTKEGYTFSGWDKQAPATMPAEDVTISGTFTVNSYDAVFNANGGAFADGQATATVSTNYGVVPTAPTATRVGYTFAGWSPALTAMVVGGASYTATWTADTNVAYTVETYKMNLDGTTYAMTDETFYGTTDTTATAATPAIEGFTYNEGLSTIEGTIAGDGSLVLEVYYDRNQYTFKTVVEGVETPATYYYGADVTAPATPSKVGYKFTGWDGEVPATMPAKDVTLTAQFEVLQYTISFANTGDSVINDITLDYGAAVTAPDDPVKEGYSFSGWDKEIPKNMPAENVTITASWTINQYKVIFLNAEGGVHSESELDYATAITAAPATNPDKEYYTFEGWSLDADPAEDATPVDFATANLTVPEGGITFYPIFKRITVTLAVKEGKDVIVDTEDENIVPPVTGYIYGLTTRLSKAKLLSDYLTVEGDGRLEVTLTKYKVCGTGTKVDVYDRNGTPDDTTDDTLVETYYIIIFGDINGDSDIDSSDTSMLRSESIGLTSWSYELVEEEYDYCKVLAGDVNNDGRIDQNGDIMPLIDVTVMMAEVDQKTGEVIYY